MKNPKSGCQNGIECNPKSSRNDAWQVSTLIPEEQPNGTSKKKVFINFTNEVVFIHFTNQAIKGIILCLAIIHNLLCLLHIILTPQDVNILKIILLVHRISTLSGAEHLAMKAWPRLVNRPWWRRLWRRMKRISWSSPFVE